MKKIKFIVLLSLSFMFLLFPAKVKATDFTPDPNLWVTNGTVISTLIDGDSLYIGGEFSFVGTYTGGGVKFEEDSIQRDENFPLMNGEVSVYTSDNVGGWYVGGYFTKVGNTDITTVVHIKEDGSVDQDFNSPFNVDDEATVETIILAGSDLYLGGEIGSISGEEYGNIVKLNAETGVVDDDFSASMNSDVKTLAFFENSLYVGGYFTSVNEEEHNYLVKLDSSSGDIDESFNAGILEGVVYTILFSGRSLFVGGNLVIADEHQKIVKLDAESGEADDSFVQTDVSGYVLAMALSGSDLYLGGSFSTALGGEAYSENIVKINADSGQIDGTFNPDSDDIVRTLALSESGLYAGGDFSSIGGEAMNYFAKLNSVTGFADDDFDLKIGGVVESVAVSGTDLLVGGSFETVGGEERNNIAKLDISTGQVDTAFDPDCNGLIYTLAISGGSLFAGGQYDSIGGGSRYLLSKLDTINGQLETDFDANISGGSYVFSIVPSGSELYVGGSFTEIGGETRWNIAKINAETGDADEDFDPHASNEIYSAVLSGSYLYVGGNFTSIGGETRNYIAKISASNGDADESFDPNANNYVKNLALSDANLYVGGNFTSIGGKSRNRIAKLDLSSGEADSDFNPDANGNVQALALSGAYIYAGGSFTVIGGENRSKIAKLNAVTGEVDQSFHPDFDSLILALTATVSELYAGGEFTSINGDSSYRYVARFFSDEDISDPESPTDTDSPDNNASDIDIQIGGKKEGKLKRNKAIHINRNNLQLSGSNTEAESGTMKIYERTKKGGKKRIKTIDIDSNGNWETTLKIFKNGKTETLYFKTFDSSGNSSDYSGGYEIKLDRDGPIFDDSAGKNNSYSKGKKINFSATDSGDDISYYRVKLEDSGGKTVRNWRRQNESFYIIPNRVPYGKYTLVIRAYDKAGNWAEKRIMVAVK
jgi:trimeric autotransporter adhesin